MGKGCKTEIMCEDLLFAMGGGGGGEIPVFVFFLVFAPHRI